MELDTLLIYNSVAELRFIQNYKFKLIYDEKYFEV